MTLSLPEDVEAHLGTDADLSDAHRPGVYALRLAKPDDPASAWDRQHDTRPEWFDAFVKREKCVYVGSAGDVFRRLEEHRDGEVRTTVLTELCEIESLRNLWLLPALTERHEREFEERKVARLMRREYPETYVHQR